MKQRFSSLDAKVIEFKEICLQILNILEPLTTTNNAIDYAYPYVEAVCNGEVDRRAKLHGRTLDRAYDVQLSYIISNLAQWKGSEARAYKSLLKLYQEYFKGNKNTGSLDIAVSPLWSAIRGIGD